MGSESPHLDEAVDADHAEPVPLASVPIKDDEEVVRPLARGVDPRLHDRAAVELARVAVLAAAVRRALATPPDDALAGGGDGRAGRAERITREAGNEHGRELGVGHG